MFTLDTEGSSGSYNDTVMTVYSGLPGSFVEVGCDDDSGTGLLSRIADLPVTAGTTYYVSISRYSNTPTASPGTVVFNNTFVSTATVPGVPQAPSAVWSTTTRAQVSFTPPLTNGGSAITSYLAQCTSSDGGTTRTKTGAASPLTVTSLTAGKTYQCRVRATNAVGTGPFSAFVPALAVPGVPQAPSAVWSTTTRAQVSFTPPASNGGSAITGYFAQCTSSDGGTTRTKTGAASPLTVTSLTAGKTYQCRVRATNVIGTGIYSAFVPVVLSVPGAPRSPLASFLLTSHVDIATGFMAPLTNGGSAITSYFVQCTSSDGGTTRTESGAASPITVTSATPGKTYQCRVRATNAIGNGPYSAFVPVA